MLPEPIKPVRTPFKAHRKTQPQFEQGRAASCPARAVVISARYLPARFSRSIRVPPGRLPKWGRRSCVLELVV